MDAPKDWLCWDPTLTIDMAKVELTKAWTILISWANFWNWVKSNSNSRDCVTQPGILQFAGHLMDWHQVYNKANKKKTYYDLSYKFELPN